MRGDFVWRAMSLVWCLCQCVNANGPIAIDKLSTVPSPLCDSAPWMVNLTLALPKPGPHAEGRLLLKITDTKKEDYFHWSSNPMVITSDPRTVSWWMPPCILSEARQASLQAIWQDSEARETFIDEWPIKSSDRSRVTTHVAVVLGHNNQPLPTKILEHASLARSIQLSPNYTSTLTPQHVSSIVADQMPTSPLSCGAFNAIILTGPGFAKLSPKRLTCLQRWVRAGGQLLVLPYGEPLRKEHETFLRTVAKGGIEPLAFGRHPITRMLGKPSAAATVFRHGLGRTLILDSKPQLDTKPQRRQWNQILCRWWFAPGERLGVYDGIRRFDTVSGPGLNDLLSQLDQAGPWHRHRPVSLLVLAGLGLGLMFLIGPGDYQLLGRWNCRRWTWLLFPIVTLSTAYAIQTFVERSYRQMPVSTHRYIDLDTSGAPVRESTFHLSTPAQEFHTTDNVKNAIHTRASKGGYPLEYQGSFPIAYQVNERRLRWASSIHRTFRIAEPNEAAPAEISQLDWISLNPVSNPWTAERRTEIRDLVKRQLAEPGVKVHFLGANRREKAPLTLGRRDSTSPYSSRHWSQHVHSPRGGPNLGDMVLHDPQLKKQRTLVIELKKGRETVFYRSTYY